MRWKCGLDRATPFAARALVAALACLAYCAASPSARGDDPSFGKVRPPSSAPPPAAPGAPIDLDDAWRGVDRLASEFEDLYSDSDIPAAEALEVCEQLLAREQQLLAALSRQTPDAEDLIEGMRDQIAAHLDMKADLCEEARRWDEGLAALARAAEIWTELYGRDDWQVRDCGVYAEWLRKAQRLSPVELEALAVMDDLNNDVADLFDEERYEQAISIARRAAGMAGKLYGEDHPYYGAALGLLGSLSLELGEFEQAIEYLQEEIELIEEGYGGVHPDLGGAYLDLGDAYYGLEEFEEALEAFQQESDVYRQTYGRDSPEYAESLHDQADVYEELGDNVRAARLRRQADDILGEDTLGPTPGSAPAPPPLRS